MYMHLSHRYLKGLGSNFKNVMQTFVNMYLPCFDFHLSDMNREELYCDECQESVSSPSIHLQLAVYVQPSPPSTFTLCVQVYKYTCVCNVCTKYNVFK